MRRSLAPSQGAAKKPRFAVPQRSSADVLRLVSGVAVNQKPAQTIEDCEEIETTSEISTDDTARGSYCLSKENSPTTQPFKKISSQSFHRKKFNAPSRNGFQAPAKVDSPKSDLVKVFKNNIPAVKNSPDLGLSAPDIGGKDPDTNPGTEPIPVRKKPPGSFKRPAYSKPAQTQATASNAAAATPVPSVGDPASCYYNVMWCKLSKKKHKNWEGDAILVTTGRSVSLLDLDGKEIGRGTGYKSTELASMQDGHSLIIGGKEIEVMSILPETEYKSGKCFQASAPPVVPAPRMPSAKPPMQSKPYINPSKDGDSRPTPRTVLGVTSTPRFDPTAPDALIMPRPSLTHQWQHNKQQLPVVDVVVDPHISRELRPHQRDGVCFLYQCMMGMRSHNGLGAILADEMGLGKTVYSSVHHLAERPNREICL